MPNYTYELKGKIFDFLNKKPTIKKLKDDFYYNYLENMIRTREIKHIQFEIFMEFYQNLNTIHINGNDYMFSKVTYNGKTKAACCKDNMNIEEALYKLANAFYEEGNKCQTTP